MIEKITFATNNIYNYKNITATPIRTNNHFTQQNELQTKQTPSVQNLQSYVVSFSGRKDKNNTDINKKMKVINSNMTPQAESFFRETQGVARKYGNKEITQLHFQYVGLNRLKEYIEKLNSGEVNFDNDDDYCQLADIYTPVTSHELFKSKEMREKIYPVINEEILNLESVFPTLPKDKKSLLPTLSKEMTNEVFNFYDQDNHKEGSDGDGQIGEGYFLDAAVNSSNNRICQDYIIPFVTKLQESVMLGDQSPQKGAHISLFDEQAKKVLKNLAIGTNMFVSYEDGTEPIYMVSSIEKMLESGEKFGSINNENTDMTYINNDGIFMYLNAKINDLAKDKDKKHIIVFNFDKMDDLDHPTTISVSLKDKLAKYAPENVKYIVLAKKDTYYKQSTDEDGPFLEYAVVSMPMLNAEQAKRAFREEPLLMAKIKKDFSPKAIDTVIDATVRMDGNYPEKAIKAMKKISAFYVDKKEITAKDVQHYIEEAKDIFQTSDKNNSVIINFDTGKKLKDVLGPESTKREIASIIRQIKNRTLGTKGIIIYPQDGYPGGGRRHSAQVIAGETKSPYVEINANDFGTKEVSLFDLLGGDSVSPETAMKKVFSLLKSQAETSPHKSAVLFIENFEYFTFGDRVSEYHQKAMSQLLREMDKAHKQGLNILVMGSVEKGDNIGESTMKSYKFVDKFEVESVYRNKSARKEIIDYYLRKNHIKIAADSDEEREMLLNNFAETTQYFAFIELMTLLGKTKNLLKERNHKQLTKADFIEAYLQVTTGRPASAETSEHRKRIVASHECGHALNLAIMYQIAEKQNIPWHLPEKVNFITLDSRGDFGGAVYSKESINDEWSFEKIFADLVWSYGGNSSEKYIYNQDGSWGITADIEQATQRAYQASSIMGQGHYYGKKSLAGVPYLSDKTQEAIEKDVDVFVKNALLVSNMIVKNYKGFIEEFTEKYASKVDTGECIITSEEFETELHKWVQRQPVHKRKQLKNLEKNILKIIELSKRGKFAKMESIN